MSRLQDAGEILEEVKESVRVNWVPVLAVLILLAVVLLVAFTGVGSVSVYLLMTATTTTSTSTSTTTTSSTTTSSTTSSTTSTTTMTDSTTSTSTTSTTTSTTSTTTTTLCGSDYQMPCSANNSCNSGLVLNSYGYCISVECAPTVPSGNSGCGAWNQNLPRDWCKPGGKNPANLFRGLAKD